MSFKALNMQEDDLAAEVYWVFLEKLIIGHQAVAAIQLATHGHNSGALRHYKPFHLAAQEPKLAFAHVNLETCGVESGIIILLSWACNLAQAIEEGHQVKAGHIGFMIGDHRLPPLIGLREAHSLWRFEQKMAWQGKLIRGARLE